MNAWHWPEWNLDICRRVCPCCLCISCIYICVHTCRCAVSAYLQFLYLITDMYVLLEFLGTGELCLYRVLSTPAAPCARTHKHITHPTTDTHMSPQQPDTAEDVLLTEKERPPYWQTRAFQRVELLGLLITFFFQIFFFLRAKKIHIHHLIKYLKVYIHTYIIFTTWDSH